ncbi:DKNYY domain-containing protein [Aquincola sp. S2]|uniref:DKNYY domain-containing protein n=1 Tax=Pseudaquabacterium terrae TaxID=2732868 RepID=A0ABX2EI89_9BURK|nr:DKNYY domain-containing protein [Aquabacterium terrae]NRF68291.1 DKNYY domain-containing protein [Aquabacterium terrae]
MGLFAWLFGCDSREPYQRKNGVWTFDDEPVGDGRVATLTVLNRRFAKSPAQAFFRATPLADADPATFEALDEHHARDAQRVFQADTYRVSQDYFTTRRVRIRVLEGADPARFQLLTGGYARDDRQAWFEGEPFAVRDVASLEVLDDGWARDKRSGYYLRTPVDGSDGASFAALDLHHARDAKRVWYADHDHGRSPPAVVSRPIRGADPASFKVLERGYACDARRVYWKGQPVDGANAASFVVEPVGGDADARDAARRYKDGRALP